MAIIIGYLIYNMEKIFATALILLTFTVTLVCCYSACLQTLSQDSAQVGCYYSCYSIHSLPLSGIASSKHVRGPQLNNIMLTIANVNQDIDTILKQDKSEGAMAPPSPWPHCSNAMQCFH